VLHRLVLVGNVLGAPAFGLLALQLGELQLLGDRVLRDVQNLAPSQAFRGPGFNSDGFGLAGPGYEIP
jgi:hypothetical protein